ncbi:ribonuclease H-like domain-containing protein, partial [Tanacetum coccineum]
MNKKNTISTQDLIIKEKIESQSETTQTVSALKLPVLKTRDYDLWSMRMEQYLTHTDYALWEVIVNGDAPAVASASAEGHIPPKIAEHKLVRKNELKAKSTLLLAILDEHLLKFHGIKDGKTLWEAIKARFGGNKESKKMQKTILKQQYENFTASRSEGVDKTYDSPQLNNEDLKQIDTDDLEEMDLKWQVAILTMRVKRFLKKTGRNLNFNGKETVGFDKTKVECYNCHRRGHFARECRASRNQRNRNGDVPRRIVPIETPTNALVIHDGIGSYDWSYQAEEGTTNFALMAYLSSGSSSSSSSSSSNNKFDQQPEVLSKANLEIIVYQLGLESLEARIVLHQKNEAVYEEEIAFLKYDVKVRDNSITEIKNQLAEALREKDDLKLKLEKFETSSMKLTKLINNQISVKNKSVVGFNSQINENELCDYHLNKSDMFKSASDSSVNEIKEENNQVNDRFKKVDGYHAVPPPYTGNYMPSRPDLSFAGLDGNTHRQEEYPRKSQSSRVNNRNWNGMMTQKLGNGFEFNKKACFVCGSLNHLIKDCNFYENKMVGKSVLNNKGRVAGQMEARPVWNNAQRVNHQNKLTHPHPKRNFVPTAVLTKSGNVPVNTAKQSSPRVAVSNSTARYVNTAASRPTVNVYSDKVNNVTTAGPKVVVSTAEGKRENAVKSLASWIWRSTGKVIDRISKDSGSYMPKRFDYIDTLGRLKHMTRNKSYLTDYQDIDGGFVAFARSPKG